MASESGTVESNDERDILAEGTRIAGRYTIEKHLAAGGMGRVYVATQAPLGRRVALKVMHHDLCQDRESVRRFFNEAVAVSQLTHPNTITVFDYGESDGGNFYIAMEFLEGEPLSARIKRQGRIDIETAVNIVIQVARSLSEAHRKGIIHRDLKPENVFLGTVEKDLVKVLDFGIAKMLQQETNTEEKLTRMGFVCGTPEYMSPEQARGEDLDGRSDLDALGVMLYEVLAGRLPFLESTPLATVLKHQNDPVPPLPPSVPQPLASFVIGRALAKEREDRPASAEAFIEELEVAAVQSGYLMDSTGSTNASELRRAMAQQSSHDAAVLASGSIDAQVPDSGLHSAPISQPTATAFGAAEPAQDRRSWLVPVLAGLSALAIVGVAAIVLLGGSETSDKAEAATSSAAATSSSEKSEQAAARTETPAPPPAIDLTPPPAAVDSTPEPVAREATVVLDSELREIEVYDEAGALLGMVGPQPLFVLAAPGQTQRELTFRKPGYFASTQIIEIPDSGSGESVRVDLDVMLEPLPVAHVDSDPSGATVYRGDQVLGTTPLDLPFEPGDAFALRFELDGYREAALEASPSEPGERITVNLKKGKDSRRSSERPRVSSSSSRPSVTIKETTDNAAAPPTSAEPASTTTDTKTGGKYKPFGN